MEFSIVHIIKIFAVVFNICVLSGYMIFKRNTLLYLMKELTKIAETVIAIKQTILSQLMPITSTVIYNYLFFLLCHWYFKSIDEVEGVRNAETHEKRKTPRPRVWVSLLYKYEDNASAFIGQDTHIRGLTISWNVNLYLISSYKMSARENERLLQCNFTKDKQSEQYCRYRFLRTVRIIDS